MLKVLVGREAVQGVLQQACRRPRLLALRPGVLPVVQAAARGAPRRQPLPRPVEVGGPAVELLRPGLGLLRPGGGRRVRPPLEPLVLVPLLAGLLELVAVVDVLILVLVVGGGPGGPGGVLQPGGALALRPPGQPPYPRRNKSREKPFDITLLTFLLKMNVPRIV